MFIPKGFPVIVIKKEEKQFYGKLVISSDSHIVVTSVFTVFCLFCFVETHF